MSKSTSSLSRSTLHSVKRLWWEWLSPHKASLGLLIVLIAISGGATGLYPVLINKAYDAFTLKDQHAILLAPLFVIGITSIKGFALYGQTVLTNTIVTRIEADMQTALYTRLIEADLAQLSRHSPASLTQRFTTDFTYIKEALTRLSTVLLREAATITALVAAMIWIDPFLTLIAGLTVPLVAIPIGRIGKKLKRIATSTQEQIGSSASLISESLAGARMAKTYALEPYLNTKARQAFEDIRRLKMKAANARGRLDPLLEIGGGMAVAGVLVLIGTRIVEGQSTVGEFTGFVTALLLAAQPARALGNLNAILQEAGAALNRFYSVMDEKPRIQNPVEAKNLAVETGSLTFRNVHFEYETNNAALRNINFTVQGGQTVALVGRSGSGKSTLLSLVPRLYDVTQGAITIDGQDIRSVSLKTLRDAIAVVSQDVMLFDDTVANNIAFGRQEASRTEIEDAAKAAAAHDFISRMSQGYDTPVGSSGGRLSGGERQRIALARAFLKNAPILLLDEATSALDPESEQKIQAALKTLMKGRTTLVIAHRLSTVRDADMIVVMDQGAIVETGTHDTLIAKGGLYASLHRLHLADDVVTPAA